MEAPAISLIIPAHNAASYIDRCLASVKAQTFKNFELILVDDASEDETASLLEAWHESFPGFTLIRHDKNEGVSISRNDAITIANGAFLAFADIDDVLAPTMLETLYNMTQRYDAQIAQIQYKLSNPNKPLPKLTRRQTHTDTDVQVLDSHEALLQMLLTEEYAMWSRLYARELFYPDEDVCPPGLTCEDRVANFKLLTRANRIAVSNRIEYYYMLNTDSLSYGGLTLTSFDLLIADDLIVQMAYRLGDEEVLALALDRQAKGAFSLLAKWIRFGITDNRLNKSKAIDYLLTRYTQDYPRLIHSQLPLQKRLLAHQIHTMPFIAYDLFGGKKRDTQRRLQEESRNITFVSRATIRLNTDAGSAGQGSYSYKPGQKLLTIVMPCYNVQDYLERGLQSFADERLNDTVEVLIINDGSTDNTIQIAERFVRDYPSIFKLINKENGGHGSGINVGIQQATGLYFRIVDGDDWVNTENLIRFVNHLGPDAPDILIDERTLVDKLTQREKPEVFPSYITTDRVLDFAKICNVGDTESYISIQTLTTRTELLRAHDIHVSEGVFYEDYEFIVKATCYARTVEFLPLIVYEYLVGNADQSMSAKNMANRYLQHETILKALLDFAENEQFDPAITQYLARKIQLLVHTHYNVLLIYDDQRKRGVRRAHQFHRWLKRSFPDLAQQTDRRYKEALILHYLGFDDRKLNKLMRRK